MIAALKTLKRRRIKPGRGKTSPDDLKELLRCWARLAAEGYRAELEAETFKDDVHGARDSLLGFARWLEGFARDLSQGL